jgi:hypothetical protein
VTLKTLLITVVRWTWQLMLNLEIRNHWTPITVAMLKYNDTLQRLNKHFKKFPFRQNHNRINAVCTRNEACDTSLRNACSTHSSRVPCCPRHGVMLHVGTSQTWKSFLNLSLAKPRRTS